MTNIDVIQAASEVQRNMRMVSNPARVDPADIKSFLEAGYNSVDETQVVRIETNKYFDFLMNLITAAGWQYLVTVLGNLDIVGGSIELGTNLTKQDLDKLKLSGHVVNCLGTQ